MKKILALAVAGSLMATSSICVFASEATSDMNVQSTDDANPSITAKVLQGQLNEANQKIGAQNEQIKNLQAQNANNESTIRTLQQQFEAFKQAQEKNNATLTNEKNALSNQLANTQKSLNEAVKARDTYKDKYANATKGPARPETPSRAAQLSKNNAVGNGNGGYVAQGGHVQIIG